MCTIDQEIDKYRNAILKCCDASEDPKDLPENIFIDKDRVSESLKLMQDIRSEFMSAFQNSEIMRAIKDEIRKHREGPIHLTIGLDENGVAKVTSEEEQSYDHI